MATAIALGHAADGHLAHDAGDERPPVDEMDREGVKEGNVERPNRNEGSGTFIERTALALIGNEEAVGAFLLAGWGQRRLSSTLECNWMCARESTPVDEIETAWRTFVSSPHVAVLLLSAAVGRRIRDVTSDHRSEPTVVEIPSADSPPRVTCSVYEPYSGWRGAGKQELAGRLASAFCAGGKASESPVWSNRRSSKPTNPRIDALVAAVFRVATLGVSDEDDDDDEVRTSWQDAGGLRQGQHTPNAALNFKLQVLNAATTEIAELLQSQNGARDFVRALNRQRTRMVDVSAAFPFLAGLMLTLLDRCQAQRDVDSILTAMMLAQSFYRTRAGNGREYLKAAIQSHPVWADVFFWREALALCVWKQRASYSDSPRTDWNASTDPGEDRMLAPPPPPRGTAEGDEDRQLYTSCLPSIFRFAAATESAERVAFWSQLGGIVHAMLEFGTHPDVVRAFADAVCAEHNLSRHQRTIIVQHIESVRRSQQQPCDEGTPSENSDVSGTKQAAGGSPLSTPDAGNSPANVMSPVQSPASVPV